MGTKVQDEPHWLTKLDGWHSPTTGLGGANDKGASLKHTRGAPISKALAESLWTSSGIGAVIVEEIINDALSPGWGITLPATEDGQQGERDAAEKAAEINGKLNDWHSRTQFLSELKRHKGQTGAYGGSVLRLGVDDGSEPFEPLKDRIGSFDWVKSFDRHNISGSGEFVADPRSPHYSFPAHYMIGSMFAGHSDTLKQAQATGFTAAGLAQRVNLTATQENANAQIIHADRTWRSDGPYLSDQARVEQGGWGQSAYQRTIDSIKGWDSTQQNIRHIVQDFVQITYSIKGFQQLVLSKNERAIRNRFSLMDRMRSMMNVVITDADQEEVKKLISSTAGLPEIVDRIMLDTSASSRIPIVRLFGPSPGGFGTGAAEGLNWRQQVASYRTEKLHPLLRYVYGLLFKTPEFAMVPDGWGIEFGAMDEPTEAEREATRKLTAERDAIYISTGVLDAPDVTASRFGGAEYNAETTVALEGLDGPEADTGEGVDAEAARLNAEALEGTETTPTGESTPPAEEDFNGAQMASLTEMAIKVSTGELAAESAENIALLGFTRATPEAVRAIFQPAKSLVLSKPDPAPATLPNSGTEDSTTKNPPNTPTSQNE